MKVGLLVPVWIVDGKHKPSITGQANGGFTSRVYQDVSAGLSSFFCTMERGFCGPCLVRWMGGSIVWCDEKCEDGRGNVGCAAPPHDGFVLLMCRCGTVGGRCFGLKIRE